MASTLSIGTGLLRSIGPRATCRIATVLAGQSKSQFVKYASSNVSARPQPPRVGLGKVSTRLESISSDLGADGGRVQILYREDKDDEARRLYKTAKDQNSWTIPSSTWSSPSGLNVEISHPSSGHSLVINRQWLRDACGCEKCIDPYSGQKTYSTANIPALLPVESLRTLDNNSLEVVWQADFHSSGEPHVSRFDAATVRSWFLGHQKTRQTLPRQVLWDKNIFSESNSIVQYDDWISGGAAFHAAVTQLHEYGLIIVDGVPESQDSVVTLANQIGEIMDTFYGRTWDVQSKPEAENVAYTNSYLGLHQDLLYTKDPPRIQLLHCLENTCNGGESIFSDAHRARRLLQLEDPKSYHALRQRKLRYHYTKQGRFYERYRCVLEGDGVFWSPPFQSPDQSCQQTVQGSEYHRRWMEAAKRFQRLLEEEQWVYECKLKPGQCVIFDNLRVLHGRRQFDTASGSRWLKGTYVSSDMWKSKRIALRSEIMAASQHNPGPALAQTQKMLSYSN